MREIIPQQLWLGNALDREPRRLYDMGITALVDLAVEELQAHLTRDLMYCRFPLVDGAGNSPEVLTAAIEMTASLIRKQVPTLVTCAAGMSRSPAIIAATLAFLHDDSPDDCLQRLIAGHPHDVSPSLWGEVKSAYSGMLG